MGMTISIMIHDMDTFDFFMPFSTGIVRAFLLATCFDTTYVFVFVLYTFIIFRNGVVYRKRNKSEI